MPINDPNQPPGLSRPRGRVVYNGAALPNLREISITTTNNYAGDTFNASFAIKMLETGIGSQVWWASQQDDIQVDLQIGIVPPGAPESAAVWTSALIGIVDRIDMDPFKGTIKIDGRDLTAKLRDSSPGGYAVNQTSSELVTTLATSVGLTPVVTKTTALVGRYFTQDYAVTGLNATHHVRNKWDAIVELARFEGFDAFTSGTSLYFQPPTAETATPWIIKIAPDPETGILHSNIKNMQLRRAQHIAKGIRVNVQSWHVKNAKKYTAGAGLTSKTAQVYNVIRPGLTQEQAEILAHRYLRELTRHERTISGEVPGDMLLNARSLMALQGTGTSFDQSYYPVSINRNLTMSAGFAMYFTAKNQSPQVQALQASQGATADG